jgi:hypothetical protein
VLDYYHMYTANDKNERDPKNWKIYRLKDDPAEWQLIGRALNWSPVST